MINRRFGVIGNQGVTTKCLQLLGRHAGVEVAFVIFDPARQNPGRSVKDYCDAQGIACYGMTGINTRESLDVVRKSAPDMVLSISNYWVMKKELLAIPKNGVVNFHNGLPSRYRGINIPSWVIMNGETTHGVMWHFADEGVDSGDVIAYDTFEVEKEETAASLMVKCINGGVALFARILPKIVANEFQRSPQVAEASYYSLRDLPENEGVLDFRWPFEKIDRMVRGLNYLPFPNPYCFAKIKTHHGGAVINKVSWRGGRKLGVRPREVVAISDQQFLIACADGILSVDSSMDERQRELSFMELGNALGVEVGCMLDA